MSARHAMSVRPFRRTMPVRPSQDASVSAGRVDVSAYPPTPRMPTRSHLGDLLAWPFVWIRGFALIVALVVGCDQSTAEVAAPAPEPFAEKDDATLRTEIQAALADARSRGSHVLLVFVASWCRDCHEVLDALNRAPAKNVLASRYETVFVDVGRFDRHNALLEKYRVESIATLVVLDGEARRVATSTFEPISKRKPLTADALAAWLRDPQDPPPDGRSLHPGPEEERRPQKRPPLFPPEVVR